MPDTIRPPHSKRAMQENNNLSANNYSVELWVR